MPTRPPCAAGIKTLQAMQDPKATTALRQYGQLSGIPMECMHATSHWSWPNRASSHPRSTTSLSATTTDVAYLWKLPIVNLFLAPIATSCTVLGHYRALFSRARGSFVDHRHYGTSLSGIHQPIGTYVFSCYLETNCWSAVGRQGYCPFVHLTRLGVHPPYMAHPPKNMRSMVL